MWNIMQLDNSCFSFRGVQTRSRYLTWIFVCIIPLHWPSLLSHKRKLVEVLCLAGWQGAELERKQAVHRRNHSLFPIAPQAFHPGSFSIGHVPGFTPIHHPGWKHAPQTHSSDSKGLPPPVQPQHSVWGWEDVNNRLGGLEIRTDEIQTTLNTHVQDSVHCHQ
jgi:hypothetical protein